MSATHMMPIDARHTVIKTRQRPAPPRHRAPGRWARGPRARPAANSIGALRAGHRLLEASEPQGSVIILEQHTRALTSQNLGQLLVASLICYGRQNDSAIKHRWPPLFQDSTALRSVEASGAQCVRLECADAEEMALKRWPHQSTLG